MKCPHCDKEIDTGDVLFRDEWPNVLSRHHLSNRAKNLLTNRLTNPHYDSPLKTMTWKTFIALLRMGDLPVPHFGVQHHRELCTALGIDFVKEDRQL